MTNQDLPFGSEPYLPEEIGIWLAKKKGMHHFPNWVTSSPQLAPVSLRKTCSLSLAQHGANGGQCRYQIFGVQEQGSLWISLASECLQLATTPKASGNP